MNPVKKNGADKMTLFQNPSGMSVLIDHMASSMKGPMPLQVQTVESFLDSLGVCVHFSGPCEKELDWITNAGIRHIRDELCWEWVEKEAGQIEIPEEKMAWIETAVSRGIQILMILNYGNPIYPHMGMGSSEKPDINYELFGRYVDFIVTHLKDKILRWEIWNEPNSFLLNSLYGGDWRGGGWVDAYARLADITLDRIRSIDASAFVMTAGMEPPIAELVIPQLRAQYDAISLHPYSHPLLPEYTWLAMEQLAQSMKRRNIRAPFIVTEQGYPAISGTGKFMWGHSATITPNDQARFLLRVFCGNFLCGIPRTYWYDLVCDGMDPDDQEHNFGILNFGADVFRPAYSALKTLTSVLNRKSEYQASSSSLVKDRKIHVSFNPTPSSPPRGLLLASDPAHFFLILWKESKSRDLLEVRGPDPRKRVFHEDGAPEKVLVTLPAFSAGSLNATVIDPVDGMESEKPIHSFSQGSAIVVELPLKESPVIVEMKFQ